MRLMWTVFMAVNVVAGIATWITDGRAAALTWLILGLLCIALAEIESIKKRVGAE